MQDKLPIAIVSDIVCPWCFIGKARLETALAQHGLTDRVAITWLPYELNPDMPAEGMDRTAYLDAKFGPGKRKEIEIRLSEAALESGVTFNWSKVTKSVNTRMAHMLVAAASTVQRGSDMKAALFRAYFQGAATSAIWRRWSRSPSSRVLMSRRRARSSPMTSCGNP